MTDNSKDQPADGGPESKNEARVKLARSDPLRRAERGEDEREERVMDALLTDYQTASEEARYRDRLITQTFYLTFVVGGLLLNGAITVFSDLPVTSSGRYLALASVCGLGAVSFFLLLVFADSFRHSRDSAWARRDEIESYVRSQYPAAWRRTEVSRTPSLSAIMNTAERNLVMLAFRPASGFHGFSNFLSFSVSSDSLPPPTSSSKASNCSDRDICSIELRARWSVGGDAAIGKLSGVLSVSNCSHLPLLPVVGTSSPEP